MINDSVYPALTTEFLNAIFKGVYSGATFAKRQQQDFVNILYAMQRYNRFHRLDQMRALFPIFEQHVGELERNSEGSSFWLGLCLAIKDLLNLNEAELIEVLKRITVRK
jgi:hypothetical protein